MGRRQVDRGSVEPVEETRRPLVQPVGRGLEMHAGPKDRSGHHVHGFVAGPILTDDLNVSPTAERQAMLGARMRSPPPRHGPVRR